MKNFRRLCFRGLQWLLVAALSFGMAACIRKAQISPIASPIPVQTRLPGSETDAVQTQDPSSPVETEPIIPTSSPLGQPTSIPRSLAVFSLVAPDVLNVRSEPGVNSAILEFLSADESGIQTTGNTQQADGWLWIEITRPDDVTGWVAAEFMVEEIDPALACADSRLTPLLDRFIQAIRQRDGEKLGEVVSPLHGLRIHLNQDDEGVVINQPLEITSLFNSDATYDWGLHPTSSESLIGKFTDRVLPSLLDVVGTDPKRVCNTLQQGLSYGNTSEQIAWPALYQNLNFVALYRPAPSGEDLNWRTWAVGIDFVNGQPYVAVLVQYYWIP